MKKLIVVVCLLAVMAVGIQAQEAVPKWAYAGLLYNKGMTGAYGIFTPVASKADIYMAASTAFGGKVNAVGTDFIFGKSFTPGLFTGLLIGPSADWVDPSADPTNYITTASGAIVSYNFPKSIIVVWGVVKYKWSIDTNDLYKDGVMAGGGLALKL